MARNILKDEKGMAAAFAAVAMFMLLALVGLTVDGGIMIYNKVKLEAATEAAAHSTQCAYDVDLWNDYGIVELNPTLAQQAATVVLTENFPEAMLESCEIDPLLKNVATVKAKVKINTVFMRIFGITESTLQATVKNTVS